MAGSSAAYRSWKELPGPSIIENDGSVHSDRKSNGRRDIYDKNNAKRYLKHEDAVSAPLVIPASPEGYSEEEAKQEAGAMSHVRLQ